MMWNYALLAMIIFFSCATTYIVGWLNGVVYGIAFGDAKHGN